MQYSIDMVEEMASPTTVKRGRAYFEEGRVQILHSSATEVSALVQGSGRHVYPVSLSLSDGYLFSDCSCPVGEDCKHGVATAFAWLSRPTALASETPLETWLQALEEQSPSTPGPPQLSRYHLLYFLQWLEGLENPGADPLMPTTLLVPMKAYLKKNGEWGQLAPYTPAPRQSYYLSPAFFTPEDESIHRLLESEYTSRGYRVLNELGSLALWRALETGRLYARNIESPLRAGPQQTLAWRWYDREGQRHLEPYIDSVPHWHRIDTEPPCYINLDSFELGTLHSTIPARQLQLLCEMPPVPGEEMTAISLRLRQQFAPQQLPLPEEPDVVELSTPTPHLTLVAGELPEGPPAPGALLHFDYGPVAVEPNYLAESLASAETLHTIEDQTFLVKRDFQQEHDYCNELADRGLGLCGQLGRWQHVWAADGETAGDILSRWRRLEHEAFPALQAAGWTVSVHADYHIPVKPVQIDTLVRDGESQWFDFELKLSLGDRELSSEAVIAHWLESGSPDELLLLDESGWLQVDAAPLQTLRDLFESLMGEQSLDTPVRLPAFRAAQLAELPDLDDRDAPLTRELTRKLQQFDGLDMVPAPAQLQASLRPYQQEGLNWLHFLYSHGFGGILADDMGLGKTLQTLALLQHLKDVGQLQKPALIVAPTSVAGNWLREATQFAPELISLLVHGPKRHAAFAQIASSDLVVTTYPLLLRDYAQYDNRQFSLLVLDEAQTIKNPATKLAQQVRKLHSQTRLCLSGTPLENHLGELWALMDFALPGLLGGQASFRKHFRGPIEEHGDRERQRQLAARIAPFLLRRTKGEVVTDLPQKTETVEYVELAGRQRALYESIRVSMQKRIQELVARQGMARSHIQFLDALLKLRQTCIDPRLVKLDKAAGIHESTKLEWLRETVPQLLEEGRSLLVFSQFTEVLALVETELKSRQIHYAKLTGKTRKRQEAIDRFQRGEVRLFLISLKAGGSGLNLTAADVVIHLDPWWNPAVESQASDRAHRIGQDKPVFIYKLIAAGTVEERIQELQVQKRELADTLFSDSGAAGLPQDGETLLELLGPDTDLDSRPR